VSDDPATPEGRLIRDWRSRQSPKMSIPELARRLGWSDTKMHALDLGRTSRVAERHPSAGDMARIAAELRIPPEELGKTAAAAEIPRSVQVLTQAAEILRSNPAGPPAVLGTAREIADMADLIGLLIPAHPRADLLALLWRDEDGEGGPRPVAERVALMLAVLRPGTPTQAAVRRIG
jgi:transcriptional regulator with XRE-family HTH domain